MEARNRCGMCTKEAPVTKTPGPKSVQILKLYNKNYKGGPLCPRCFDMVTKRTAEVVAAEKYNRENQTPNTSSSNSLGAVTRPETEPISADSRTERGDSLQAQKGTQTTKSFSQPIGSRETSRDSAMQENAQRLVSIINQELAQDAPSTESSDIPAQMEIFTPSPNQVIQEENRSSRKRPRVEMSDIEEIEEREEDAPPEKVAQVISEEEVPVPTVDVEDAEDIQEAEISIASSSAPMPRHPRIRDEDLREVMEKSQSLENRGPEVVNNMPRTHAG